MALFETKALYAEARRYRDKVEEPIKRIQVSRFPGLRQSLQRSDLSYYPRNHPFGFTGFFSSFRSRLNCPPLDIIPRITAEEKRAQQRAREQAQKEREEEQRRRGAKKYVRLFM